MLKRSLPVPASLNDKKEGYAIFHSVINNKKVIVVAGTDDSGKLYGMFHFLRLLQTETDISEINIESNGIGKGTTVTVTKWTPL